MCIHTVSRAQVGHTVCVFSASSVGGCTVNPDSAEGKCIYDPPSGCSVVQVGVSVTVRVSVWLVQSWVLTYSQPHSVTARVCG